MNGNRNWTKKAVNSDEVIHAIYNPAKGSTRIVEVEEEEEENKKKK